MAVDKNLFMYDLAIVAIMRNEAAYVKEWIEYHWAAGVDHFYIYDNESPDNFKEVLQPYIDKGIVTYEFYPGKTRQCEAYMEAIKKYRFFCRYMAFIDADEFIFPQNTDKSIVEVVDEILDQQEREHRAGIEINWMMYGSNNLEKADYSKGVLERFTRRAEKFNAIIKTIANPRKIDYLHTPHYMVYFGENTPCIDERYKEEPLIFVNHYSLRSREEYEKKIGFSAAYGTTTVHTVDKFTHEENNDVFDDSILKYRDARQSLKRKKKRTDSDKMLKQLMNAIDPILKKTMTEDFFYEKMETFLLCLKLTKYLEEDGTLKEETAKNIQTVILYSIIMSVGNQTRFSDYKLLLSELPDILVLNSHGVEKLVDCVVELIPQLKKAVQMTITSTEAMGRWRDFNDLDNLLRMLKAFKNKKI